LQAGAGGDGRDARPDPDRRRPRPAQLGARGPRRAGGGGDVHLLAGQAGGGDLYPRAAGAATPGSRRRGPAAAPGDPRRGPPVRRLPPSRPALRPHPAQPAGRAFRRRPAPPQAAGPDLRQPAGREGGQPGRSPEGPGPRRGPEHLRAAPRGGSRGAPTDPPLPDRMPWTRMENRSSTAQRPTDEELRLALDRIGRRLADLPPDLDPEAHRQRVAGMLRDVGEANFYNLLSIPATARAQEVHEAYDQIARLVHPANAGRLGLAGREGVLEMLFERLTLAYLTLIQTDRRKVYDRDLDPGAWGAAAFGAGAEQRREEVRGVAQGYYQR